MTTALSGSDHNRLFAQERSFQSCAALLAKIGRFDIVQAKLNEAKFSRSDIKEGMIFFGDSHIGIHPFGGELLVFSRDDQGLAHAIQDLVNSADARNEIIVVSGNVPARRQASDGLKLLPKSAHKKAFFMPRPSEVSRIKQSMLEKNYTRVQIILDIDVTDKRLLELYKIVNSGDASLSGKFENVEILTLKQLSNNNSLKDTLENLTLPAGTFRITFGHQSRGTIQFTDGSIISVREYSSKRLKSGAMDILAGCDLEYDPNGWLIIERKVLVGEILKAAAKIQANFVEGAAPGTKILGTLFADASDVGAPAGANAGTNDRTQRLLLKLLDAAPLIVLGMIQEEEEEKEKHQNEGETTQREKSRLVREGSGEDAGSEDYGVPLFGVMDSTLFTERVEGSDRWFGDLNGFEKIKKEIGSVVAMRPVVFLDQVMDRISFFIPSPSRAAIFPAPVVDIPIKEKLSEERRKILQNLSGLFWFYVSNGEGDHQKTRQMLLEWQESNGVKLPFLMMEESPVPTQASWVMLKPFFQRITHWGDGIPEDGLEAAQCGIFWCTSGLHQSVESVAKYTELFDAKNTPFPLSQNMRETASFLSERLMESSTNACLMGVWTGDRLRTAGGEILNTEWANNKPCQGRIAFISISPLKTQSPRAFYEMDKSGAIPDSLRQLIRLSADDRSFEDIQPKLTEIYSKIMGVGGTIAISVCGHSLLISE